MKKFLLRLLSIVMCFTLVACNSNTANNAVPSNGIKESIEESAAPAEAVAIEETDTAVVEAAALE